MWCNHTSDATFAMGELCKGLQLMHLLVISSAKPASKQFKDNVVTVEDTVQALIMLKFAHGCAGKNGHDVAAAAAAAASSAGGK